MRFDIPDRTWQHLVPAAACALTTLVMLAGASSALRAQQPTAPPAPADTAVRPIGPVRPGDVLQLKVYGEEAVSGEYVIDNEGLVTIPGVGTVRVANLTPTGARAMLEKEIRTRFSNPEFSADFRIRVYVLGPGVANPGPFVVEPGTNFIKVLAIAGGQTDRADLKRATVIREGKTYPIDLAAGLAGGYVGQYPVFSNDIINVPARRGLSRENIALGLNIVGTLLTVVTLVISLRN